MQSVGGRLWIVMLSYRKEFQEKAILSITELKLEYSIGSDLADRGQSSGFQNLSESCDKSRGHASGGPREIGSVASETNIDEELLLHVGFRKLEQYNFRGKVVDVGYTERGKTLVELVSDDLDTVKTHFCRVSMEAQRHCTFTSRDEKRCFILALSVWQLVQCLVLE